MSFLTRLFLVTLLLGSCRPSPQNQEESILLTLKSIAARQDSLLQKFDGLEDKVLAQHELLEDKLLPQHELLEDKLLAQHELLEDKLLAQHELLEDKLLAQHELLEDKLLAQHEQLENLKLSVVSCSTEHQVSTYHDLLATDECEKNTNNCSIYATCKNLPLYFECSCMAGYSGDGVVCEDIDECNDDNNVCGDGGVCVNHPGNYSCICQDGYWKQGDICQGFVCTWPSFEVESFGCIKYDETRLAWRNAQAKCNKSGGSLLYGFTTKQQLITIVRHVQQVGIYIGHGNDYSPWVGVQGGLFVKSPSDDGPPEISSAPEKHLWEDYEPDGELGDDTQCGFVDLYDSSDPHLWDNVCSRRRASLCQILY